MNGSLLAQMHCYYMRRPSFFQCEACTDAVVMKIGKQEFDALVAESPYFARWVLADATASVTTFTMPAEDVEINVTFTTAIDDTEDILPKIKNAGLK